jgi:uncharacterized protein
MNRRIFRILLSVFIIIAVTALLYSCLGRTPQTNFYKLSPLKEIKPEHPLSPDFSIAIGPVTIPSEIDRPQIILRDHESRIKMSEYHRWSGPIQEDIASVLSSNLSLLLGTDRILPRDQESLFPFTHFIALHINRFDGQWKGEVLLDVTWSIQKNQHPYPLIVKRSVIREPVLSDDYEGLVATQSKALSGLSRLMAASVRTIRE